MIKITEYKAKQKENEPHTVLNKSNGKVIHSYHLNYVEKRVRKSKNIIVIKFY